MTTFAIGGQSSGDFRETSSRLQIFHVVTRNSVGLLTPDAFTQLNPGKVTALNAKSTTLANVVKGGVLGGSVAFTRGDVGNNYIGGPDLVNANATTCRPLGLFINDSLGNAFENTPGVASGRGPYVCGNGSTVGVSLYETKVQTTVSSGTVGNVLTYGVGDKLYASVNGYVTNRAGDAYDQADAAGPVVIGIVKIAPDANSSLLVLDLRV